MINKVFPSLQAAVADVPSGSTIMFGGFGETGCPEALIAALVEQGARDLTIVSNNVGIAERGVAGLIKNHQVRKVICSFPVGKWAYIFEEQYEQGNIELELVPQGTLAEKIRAAGAGVAAFFTPTGFGTLIADGKETRVISGTPCIMEYALPADYAFVKAHQADRMGNLYYRKAMQNFNIPMCTAATVTIAEVDEVVPVGSIQPESVHTPGIFVHRIVEARYDREWSPLKQ